MTEHECTEEARIKRNEEDIQDLWKMVEGIKSAITYRLPLWAVGVFGAMSSALTYCVTLLRYR